MSEASQEKKEPAPAKPQCQCAIGRYWKGHRWFRVLCRTLLIAVVVLLILDFVLDKVIQTSVEKFGSKALKNQTQVEKVDLSLFGGSLLIEKLVVGNPEGYKTPQAIYLGKIYVKLSPLSLLTGKIRVKTVEIVEPQFTYEVGLGNSNVGTLLDNLDEFTGGAKKAPEEKKAPEKSPEAKKGGMKVVIDEVSVKGAKVTLSAKLLGGKGIPIPLPPITLHDLGKEKEQGIGVAEAIKSVGQSIVSTFGNGEKEAESDGKSLGDSIKSLFGK